MYTYIHMYVYTHVRMYAIRNQPKTSDSQTAKWFSEVIY